MTGLSSPAASILVAAGVVGIFVGACGNGAAQSNPSHGSIGGNAGSANATIVGGIAGADGGIAPTERFSFFVTSYRAIQALSGRPEGFGGDLRYGEIGAGAGLRGADRICAEVAERAMPANGKVWRAFLSTEAESAIDRVGEGPWYDRLGRLVAIKKADLLSTRPSGADKAIVNDLPNEDGTTNHAPDGTRVDNHDTLTGSGIDGRLYSADANCSDWTSSAPDTTQRPRVGHSWPTAPRPAPDPVDGGPAVNEEGMSHWISALNESGCAAGVNLVDNGMPGSDGTVGSGGGYGGFYCFALSP